MFTAIDWVFIKEFQIIVFGMAKKKIRFTNKATNESNDLLFGGLGHEVYSLTKSISEMNDAIRWCNHHEVGEKFDCDKYSIEIIGMD